MDSETFQWICIGTLFLWVIVISKWISETTDLLKSWWRDFLEDMIGVHFKTRLKGRRWSFSSKQMRVRPPVEWPPPTQTKR